MPLATVVATAAAAAAAAAIEVGVGVAVTLGGNTGEINGATGDGTCNTLGGDVVADDFTEFAGDCVLCLELSLVKFSAPPLASS